MLKTFFFDIGNVLLFFSHEKMFAQVAACSGLSVDAIKTHLLEQRIAEQYESGQLGSEEVFQLLKERASQPFSFTSFLDAISDIFTPNESLWTLVQQIKQAGHRLIIISNTNESHFNHISSNYPILQLFDQKVLSFEVGALKPDPRIYQKALSLARCEPAECFYTDDVAKFVLSAKTCGIDSEVFVDTPTLHRQLVERGCAFLKNG